ncbi:MAG TPA: heme o synthase [Candidatus Omnitrophota bacterium]|nr:heme o synthase [Candidatus Omnitrophota bacterium]
MVNINHKKINAYIELTKPSILTLVLVTTVLGYYLGGGGIRSWIDLFFLLSGAALVCAGSGSLNHYLEREYDSKMLRTQKRPLPSGTLPPSHALVMGVITILLGVTILYIKVNILTSFLSLLTAFLYIMVYTPMKRISWWNTTIGAVPGSIPPLGGWAAATGHLNFDAGILFLILFIWQHPHFYAIAWMFKDDYRRGGFKMLPVLEENGNKTAQQVLFYSILLIPVSLVPTLTGLSGAIYFIGALMLGIGLLWVSHLFIKTRSVVDARRLLKATVVYLPMLLFTIVLDIVF